MEKSAILRLRKEPDEIIEQEEIEEEENDEFETLYKGQISKSGAAILPSKRTRKIPEIKKVISTETDLKKETPEELKIKVEEEKPLELKEEVKIPTEEKK